MSAFAANSADTQVTSSPYAIIEFARDLSGGEQESEAPFAIWDDTYVSLSLPKIRPSWSAGHLRPEASATDDEHEETETPSDPQEAARASELEKANETRLAMLARRYASRQLRNEDEARLLMATEMVRSLIRRSDADSLEVLGGMLQESAALRAESRALRERLGL